MGAIDPKFLELTEEPQFKVWRIENFEVVPWTDLGAFYTGDSYIVLSAVLIGTSKRVRRDIFFWIGSESTQDEYGTAALKAIQLDDRFGGEPTQHREVQNHESEAFFKLFEPYGGVRYMAGGVDSGFKAVSTVKGVSLYQVKGKRRPVLLQVAPTVASLNHGDAFILTSDDHVFLWVGKGANPAEKIKAAQVADMYKIKYKGSQFTRLDASATTPDFWRLLGGEGEIAPGDAASDAQAEIANVIRIYAADGFALIAEGAQATRAKLDSSKTSIIERGETIVVFYGKSTTAEQRKGGIAKGVEFLAAKGLPNWYSVSAAKEGTADDTVDLIFA
jgi:hypothetical protein